MKIRENLLSLGKYSRPGRKLDDFIALVFHWTASPGQGPDEVRHYYESDQAAQEHYGSAHYVVGIDGEILRLIPEDEMAYHVGSSTPDPASGRIYTDFAHAIFQGYCDPPDKVSPNQVTIGIEMCVTDSKGAFTPETIFRTADLAHDIFARQGFKVPLRHWDVVGWKKCPLLFCTSPDAWIAFKDLLYGTSPSAVENERTGGYVSG